MKMTLYKKTEHSKLRLDLPAKKKNNDKNVWYEIASGKFFPGRPKSK